MPCAAQLWDDRAVEDLDARYTALLVRARADPNLIGVVLSGSRAVPEFTTRHSDYDCWLILHEADDESWPFQRGSGIETVAVTVEQFARHAMVGTNTFWNRPSFLYARVELDKQGAVAAMLDAKRRLSPTEADELVRTVLDDYINSLYRSLKNHRDGRHAAGRLDGRDAIPPLLSSVFALVGRVRPFNKWLEYDLDREPLPIPDFRDRVVRLSDDPDMAGHQAMFRDVEALARTRGYGDIVDGWRPDVPFLRGEVGY